MTRKNLIPFFGVFILLLIGNSAALYAQQSPLIEQLLKLESDQYFADRDSAYLDPYYGLKKLIYGK